MWKTLYALFNIKKTYSLKPWYNISEQTLLKEGIYMSNQNYITNILKLKEENLIFKENFFKRTKNQRYNSQNIWSIFIL